MRELAILTFLTADGVMQAPRMPDEDLSGGFEHGGWAVDCWDEVMEQVRREAMAVPYDLLLGRKTYDLFAGNFASEGDANPMNSATKFVATSSTRNLGWKNTKAISGDIAAEVARRAELAPGDQRHDDEGSGGQRDPDPAFVRGFLLPQRGGRLRGDVGGQGQERRADEAVHAPLCTLQRVRVHPASLEVEAPEEDARRRALDQAVEPESDERDALGFRAGPERDAGLDHVVRHGRPDQPEADPGPVALAGGDRRGHRVLREGGRPAMRTALPKSR